MTEEAETPGSAEITALLEQARDAVAKTNEARQRADSDAGYAHNAKVASEDHQKALAAIRAQADVHASWFTTSRQGAEEAHALIVKVKAEAEEAKVTTASALAEVEKAHAAVTSAAEEAEASKASAAKANVDATAQAKQATTHAANAEGSADEAEASKDKAAALTKELEELAEGAREQALEVGKTLAEVNKASESAAALVASMKAADTKATNVLGVITKHEADLAKLKADFTALHERIEGLLPNATSAGLATAFRDQKARFQKPQQLWLVTFIGTILALLASSLWGLPRDDSWDSMARHLVNRLPLIAPLIWLAIYAGRHYGLALRLQEEYAYKEAVSAAFEGYKREMSTVGATSTGTNPLVTLCENVLTTLGQRPGRIYEGKHEDITPVNTAANAAKDAMAAAKDAIGAAKDAAQSAKAVAAKVPE